MTREAMRQGLRNGSEAFTLVEVLVTSSLVAIMGGLVFLSLHSGLQLFGKNIAINLPYQASRTAFDLLQRDVHASASAPRLIDASLNDVAGAGPAAGVALRTFAGGPCVVATDTAGASTVIEIKQTPGVQPRAGDLLSLPAFHLERNITAVTNNGSIWTLVLDAALGTDLIGTSTANFVAFFTRRSGYVVVEGELLRYPDLDQPANSVVVSRGVTNATPFALPVPAGTPDDRYLSVALTATDRGSSARQLKAVDANLNFTIAYRATSPLTSQ